MSRKHTRFSDKVNSDREKRMKSQAEALKKQAQADMDGYVATRSILRAARLELKTEEQGLAQLRDEYDELKKEGTSYRELRFKRKQIKVSKRRVKELTRSRKKLHNDMKEYRDGVRRKAVANICAVIAALAMLAMIGWRTTQIFLGVYYMSIYIDGETVKTVAVSLMRQVLRLSCIVYGLVVIWQSVQIWFMKKKGWNDVIRIKAMHESYWLVLVGIALQFLSLGDMLTNGMMLVAITSQMVMAALLSISDLRRFAVKFVMWVYLVGIAALVVYSLVFCRNYELPAGEIGTSTTAAGDTSHLEQMWEMSTESEFYHVSMYGRNADNEYGMTVIPGLDYACTIDCDTKEPDVCTSMTPQGLAVTEKYTFVSAYCGSKRHRSVIFMMDTRTGKYIKTIVLRNTTHAGGLAYDTKNDVLWVSSYLSAKESETGSRHASISCITLESIQAYDFEESCKSIMYRNTCTVMFPATSFITYYDGHIYAGYWKKGKQSRSMAAAYEIVNGGTSIMDEPDEAFYIPGRVQGLSVYSNQIIFSISYGVDEAKIEVYDTIPGQISAINYFEETPRQTIKMPQKLEQIYSYNGRLFCLFESGSYAYRLTAPVCMSYIVGLDETSLVKGR